MLQLERGFFAAVAILSVVERAVVEDVAVLIDFHQGRALMHGRTLERFAQMLDVGVHRTRDKGPLPRPRRRRSDSAADPLRHGRALGDCPGGTGR